MASILVLIAVAILVALALKFKNAKEAGEMQRLLQPLASSETEQPARTPLYTTKPSVLTKAELKFHRTLTKAVPEAPILPKVRMADVIEAAPGSHITDFRKISQKHFDWVICHPVTLEPLLAIELDDSSHSWSAAQRKNDQIKNYVTQTAGLQLLRINWQREYDEDSIRDKIAVIINNIADQKERVK